MTDITGAIAQEAAALRQQALDAVMSLRAERDRLAGELEALRPMLGMVGWDGTFAEAVQSVLDARDQFFEQACHNGGVAQQERARAELAEAKLARVAAVLPVVAEKLLLYYQHHPAYVGGVEHSELQRRIAEVLAATQSDSGGGWE
jgi:hypothetical protein